MCRGRIDVGNDPADGESIVDAGWFARDALPAGYLFPDPLQGQFWHDLEVGFSASIKLPLKQALF